MADAKITALTENTTPISTDIMPMVDDPAGTPATQKVTLANIMALAANPVSDDGDGLGTTSLKWSDLFLASGAVADFNSGNVTVTHSAGTLTMGGSQANGITLKLAAGGTALAPLTFQSGTNLSTPAAGTMEYDGSVFYANNVASERGVNVSMQFAIIAAGDFSLSTASGVQSCFATTQDVFTFTASTTYFFEGLYDYTRSGNTGTVAMAFAVGGGGSVTSIRYAAWGQFIAANTTGTAQSSTHVDQVASTVILATNTTAGWIRFSGILRTNAAGTLTPQISFSSTTTSPAMKAGSFIKFIRVGTSTTNVIGNIA